MVTAGAISYVLFFGTAFVRGVAKFTLFVSPVYPAMSLLCPAPSPL